MAGSTYMDDAARKIHVGNPNKPKISKDFESKSVEPMALAV